MTSLLTLLLGGLLVAIGFYLRDIRNKLDQLLIKKPEQQASVTRGSYAPISTPSYSGNVGISEAKTPQLIEFEAEQELLKKNQSL